MGAAVGTDDKKSVNVELNIVPFIDLMSCLVAFLLVTAQWVQIAQLSLKPKGRARDTAQIRDDEEKPVLSVLLQKDKIWLVESRSTEGPREIARGDKAAWDSYKETLKTIKESSYFAGRGDMELAAESIPGGGEVPYQDLIYAMDLARQVGFNDIGLTDRDGLTTKPQL